ncbi:hypothetical protein NUW58_g9676 [Xylaria curta]|uniref:Uncharacterized protein n=1 Tax=Xylaria curta TaxID=42375 RepID=A0ACC1MWD1_9PEZI|nr:hypothetical protein NUW58_g9676 [Xylaria curta]
MATETLTLPGLNTGRLTAEDFETASIRSAAPSYGCSAVFTTNHDILNNLASTCLCNAEAVLIHAASY